MGTDEGISGLVGEELYHGITMNKIVTTCDSDVYT